MYKEYRIKRGELYEKVWSKPMVKIAKEYEVSDKAIAKICDKLNIPVPGLGYWRKVEVGEKVEKRKLPDIRPTDPTEHIITKHEPDYKLIISEEAQKKIDYEGDPINKIVVPLEVNKYHILTKQIKNALENTSKSNKFLSMIDERRITQFYVSKIELRRALRIIDTLIQTLENREFLVYINKKQLCVKIFGVELGISLKEKAKRIELPQKEYTYFKEYDFLSTGKLKLSIENHYSQYSLQMNYGDILSKKVEDRLNEFIVGLIIASQESIAHDLYLDKLHKEREEKERIKKERLAAIENEKKKLQELKLNVENFHQSNLIRSYISKYKLKLLDDSLTEEQKKEIENYIEWALKQADRLDPFVESPSSILDNQKDIKEEWL